MAYLHAQRIQVARQVVLSFAVFATLVQSSYYMDDRDGRITYAPQNYWSNTTSGLDMTKLYGGSV